MNKVASQPRPRITSTLVLAWVSVLLLSLLPDVLFEEIVGGSTRWLYWAKIGSLILLIWLSILWDAARRLRAFYLVFLALLLLGEAFFRLGNWSQWQSWFANQGFSADLLGTQLQRMGIAVVMIGLLLSLGMKRSDFFLRMGDLGEPAPAMPIFGVQDGGTWKRLGLLLSLYFGLGMLAALWLFSRPAPADWRELLPVLPMVLALAGMNAFGEELNYRAALLAPMHKQLGARHSVLLTAAFFGLNHYYGVPYGLLGVALSGFIGWVLGTVMIESKGLFWPWFIHMIADVVIFSFIAMGAVTPGGA